MALVPRFAFLVHALSPLHRGVQGVRNLKLGLALHRRDGSDPWDIGELCRLGLPGVAEGVVIGIPMTPDMMLADQERALVRLERAARMAEDVSAIGLGSLCAVVAGRGEALASAISVPVTTGAAATAWALHENARAVLSRRGGPAAIIGSSGAVGQAVAALLAKDGYALRLDHPRSARGIAGSIEVFAGPADAAAGCGVVIGAGPTGGTLAVEAVAPGAVIVDVALPGTLLGKIPRSVRVLAGEAVVPPPEWWRDNWGLLYQCLAGYGPSQLFACLVEPLALAVSGRKTPFALGRRVTPEAVAELGQIAHDLGFRPRLARGWRAFPPERLKLIG